MIYLDHNATTPLSAAARGAMLPWLGMPANAASVHQLGRAAADALDAARAQVAEVLSVGRERVIFTSGATEANALALHGRRVVALATEHPSVLAWAERTLPVTPWGLLDLHSLDELDGADTLAVQFANNETGVVQDLVAVAAAARARGLRLHVDAAQALGRLPLGALAVADTVAVSAHKLGGPAGAGALVVPAGARAAPLLRGGPQERGWRAGTHALAALVGFGAAAAEARGTWSPQVRDELEAGLVALGAEVVGRDAPRLPNTSCVVFPGVLAADLVIALDLAGICVSAGAACASGSTQRSHVLAAMGVAGTGVRFSLGRDASPGMVAGTLAALGPILQRLRDES